MLKPAFEAVFADIRDLLTSTQSIFNAQQDSIDNGVYQESFNWENFYHYFAMVGLHTNSSFQTAISNDPYQNFLYQYYRDIGNSFTKSCQ